jgi:cardiolipin synthase
MNDSPPMWSVVWVVSEWVVRLVMLVYVPQRRNAAATRTWLLLIFLQPWIGLLLYAAIGRITLPRRRLAIQARAAARLRRAQEQWVQGRPFVEADIPAELNQAVTLAQNLGDFRILDGNEFELLDDYAASIQRLVEDIDAARDHVHLLFYIWADDETGRRVAAAVMRAAQRGVHCRVLMDDAGSSRALKKLAPRMRRAGVSVAGMLPVGLFRKKAARFDLRNHRKIVVIDGTIGYAGSQNLIDAESVPGLVFEDLVVRVRGPLVSQLQVVFLADHYIEREEKIAERELFPDPPCEAGIAAAQVLPSGPGYRYANAQKAMVALIHGARQRVVITTPYFIPDEAFVQAMLTAILRGVEVHLVVSSTADHKLVHYAQESYYEVLLEAGVKIHLYQPRFLHAKHLSIDDSVALIGSSNVDLRSFTLNNEITLLIYDAAVVAQLRRVQERYFAHSTLLSAKEWAKRPLWSKVLQNTARLTDSLL